VAEIIPVLDTLAVMIEASNAKVSDFNACGAGT